MIIWSSSNAFSTLDDYTKSSSAKTFDEGGFSIEYVKGSATGDWVNDTITIGGSTIKSLSMGLVTSTEDTGAASGVMGIGFDTRETSLGSNGFGAGGYPNIVDVLVSGGLINSKAYSLYLDDLGKLCELSEEASRLCPPIARHPY